LHASIARNITAQLNANGISKLVDSDTLGASASKREDDARVNRIYGEWLAGQWERHVQREILGGQDVAREAGREAGAAQSFWSGQESGGSTLGYVTEDDCPGIGDDIEHVPGVSFCFRTDAYS
jgi:hypothetical protein